MSSRQGRPRVVVTLGRLADRPEMYRLNETYVQCLLGVDLLPIGLMPGLDTDAVTQIMADVDGVLLPGGVDVNPSRYGQRVLPTSSIDDDTDQLELAVIAEARRRRIPVLGICRGAQVLNVALGGTLVQHLPSDVIDHRPRIPLTRLVHEIQVLPGSLLHQTIGRSEAMVNSWHHQAIAELGGGLRAVAWAKDGVIEAVESDDPQWWAVAVQYHPEQLVADSGHTDLFELFAKVCGAG